MITPTNIAGLTGVIGGTFDATITLYQDDAQTEPYPTNGWTWTLTVERLDTPLTEGSGLTLDSESGTITVKIDPAVTTTLEECVTHAVLEQVSTTDDTDVYFPVTLDITWMTP